MSILIRGVEMPKDRGLALIIHSDGSITVNLKTTSYKAVPVPTPHGDLIDREWLIGVAELNKDIYIEAIVDLDDLRNAPTVIEAEE